MEDEHHKGCDRTVELSLMLANHRRSKKPGGRQQAAGSIGVSVLTTTPPRVQQPFHDKETVPVNRTQHVEVEPPDERLRMLLLHHEADTLATLDRDALDQYASHLEAVLPRLRLQFVARSKAKRD